MSTKVTLGGERLGNGKKIKVDLHGWGRSTFNQDRIWRSTMATGVLTPCFIEWGTPATTFEIDINTLGHTIPTIAPLFGSFKLQVDLFACPLRLYQGILHNNAVNIGLDMKKVLFPNITLNQNNNTIRRKTNTSSLNNYLGIKGFTPEQKTFNGIAHLAYYDIFKNYYSNKQEPMAKVIGYDNEENIILTDAKVGIQTVGGDFQYATVDTGYEENNRRIINQLSNSRNQNTYKYLSDLFVNAFNIVENINTQLDFDAQKLVITSEKIDLIKKITIQVSSEINNTNEFWETEEAQITQNKSLIYDSNFRIKGEAMVQNNKIIITLKKAPYTLNSITIQNMSSQIQIKDFPLENIDDARRAILAKTQLNERIHLNTDMNFLPYSTNFENESVEVNRKKLNGLMLKTYQNDIFNTWLSTEYVELINEISSITPNEDGQITMDALILAKKVYNVLNRIAVSGGTYEDWQESVYGENAPRKAESPIYIGGTSAEITFEEVVSTASTESQPLATLGGKGVIINKKGGNIVYKCDEPCIIMGIASITPRVDYHQGNRWYMTELDNMDNLHKPGLDGIGFQNLIANNVHWAESNEKALAKQTAWINYQTAYNEVFGEFAEETEDSLAHMVLRRNYEINNEGEIQDFTTYIDPSKYNYAFAENELTSQNFWIQIGFDCKSRRKMAAYEIPNL